MQNQNNGNSLKPGLALRAHELQEKIFLQLLLQKHCIRVLADVDGMFASFPAETNIWGASSAACHGDVYTFGGGGSDWRVSQALNNAMKDYDDQGYL